MKELANKITLKRVTELLENLNESVKKVFDEVEADCANVNSNLRDSEECSLHMQYMDALEDLRMFHYRIERFKLPILEEGILKKNDNGEYCLSSGKCFEKYDVIEVFRGEDPASWQTVTIEHDGKEYYGDGLPKWHPLEGMRIRYRKQRFWL